MVRLVVPFLVRNVDDVAFVFVLVCGIQTSAVHPRVHHLLHAHAMRCTVTSVIVATTPLAGSPPIKQSVKTVKQVGVVLCFFLFAVNY